MTTYDDEARAVFGDPELDPELAAVLGAERRAEIVRELEQIPTPELHRRGAAAIVELVESVAALVGSAKDLDGRLAAIEARLAALEARP